MLPFRVVAGQLYVASPEVPNDDMIKAVKDFWPHEMRFHLVNPSAFRDMMEQFLPAPARPPRSRAQAPGLLLTGLGLLASLVALSGTLGRGHERREGPR